MSFLKITDLCIEKENWKDNLFITIDTDWANDTILNDTLEVLQKNNTKATILITNETDLINDINKNDLFELGIHPNFNYLLNGDFRYGKNYKEVIDYYMKIVPNAKVVRSHSVTQNTLILDYFYQIGLKYDLNLEIPAFTKLANKPYLDWTGLIKVPYFWQENISFKYSWDLKIENFLSLDCIRVFNFHPIHIYLNSESTDRYEKIKKNISNIDKIKQNINVQSRGVRDFLLDLTKIKLQNASTF